jgi:hypothetical protein
MLKLVKHRLTKSPHLGLASLGDACQGCYVADIGGAKIVIVERIAGSDEDPPTGEDGASTLAHTVLTRRSSCGDRSSAGSR